MAPITIALNIVLVAFVVLTVVGLQVRAIWMSRREAAAPPRRARARTQPARRLASVNG